MKLIKFKVYNSMDQLIIGYVGQYLIKHLIQLLGQTNLGQSRRSICVERT